MNTGDDNLSKRQGDVLNLGDQDRTSHGDAPNVHISQCHLMKEAMKDGGSRRKRFLRTQHGLVGLAEQENTVHSMQPFFFYRDSFLS